MKKHAIMYQSSLRSQDQGKNCGNNSTDIYVEDDVVSGPSISNSYFNNSFSPVLIKLNGKNASVENCEFERFMDTVVEIKGSQNRIIDNIFKPKSDAFNVTGIILEKQSSVLVPIGQNSSVYMKHWLLLGNQIT